MSYADYNYASAAAPTGSVVPSAYGTQEVYDSSQYTTAQQYSVESDQQQYSAQYDYSSYSAESYTNSDGAYASQPAVNYPSTYRADNVAQSAPTQAYDATLAYAQPQYDYSQGQVAPADTSSQYDYSNVSTYNTSSAQQYGQAADAYTYSTASTNPTGSTAYSSQDYSANNSQYSNPVGYSSGANLSNNYAASTAPASTTNVASSNDQHYQMGSTGYEAPPSGNFVHSQSGSYTPQTDQANSYQDTSSVYETNIFQSSQPKSTYDSQTAGYQDSQTGQYQSGSYKAPTSGGYQDQNSQQGANRNSQFGGSRSGGYQDSRYGDNRNSRSDAFQGLQSGSYQHPPQGGHWSSQTGEQDSRQNTSYSNSPSGSNRFPDLSGNQDSGSGSLGRSLGGFGNRSDNYDNRSSGYDSRSGGYGNKSGNYGNRADGFESRSGGFQDSKFGGNAQDSRRGFQKSQSNDWNGRPNSEGQQYSGRYLSGMSDSNRGNFDGNRRGDFNNEQSYNPRNNFGGNSTRGRGGNFSQSRDDNQRGNFSQSRDNSMRGSFSPRGSRGRGGFNQRREERADGNGSNQFDSSSRNHNAGNQGFGSGSWRGGGRGRGRQQGRGGFQDNEGYNSLSTRGGTFNKGGYDRRGQSHSQNQSPARIERQTSFSKPFGNNSAQKRDETHSSRSSTQSKPPQSTSSATPINKASQDKEGKAPSKPNQSIVNEVDAKAGGKSNQSGKANEKSGTNAKLEEKKTNGVHTQNPEIVQAQATSKNEVKKDTEPVAAQPKPLPLPVIKTAPPRKVPETPEEIAREEEIQRKIRESVIIIDPGVHQKFESERRKPAQVGEIEMSDELRDLLKTLTTEFYCKLCTLRMNGPQMATMHYAGKNHMKKVRTFVQTNGRSAGCNMETIVDVVKEEKKVDGPEGAESEIDDPAQKKEEEVDETRYCKVCKITFPQGYQTETHYNGKNHLKKLRHLESGTQSLECKICRVSVTSQEHLTSHLNGKAHLAQIRKMEGDNSHRGGLRGRGAQHEKRGRGRGGGPSPSSGDYSEGQERAENMGRGNGRGRGRGNWRGGFNRGGQRLGLSNDESEELYNILGLTPEKRYKFDLANYRTPSGKFYCSYCDTAMAEEPEFMHHLTSKIHWDKINKTRKGKPGTGSKIKVERICLGKRKADTELDLTMLNQRNN